MQRAARTELEISPLRQACAATQPSAQRRFLNEVLTPLWSVGEVRGPFLLGYVTEQRRFASAKNVAQAENGQLPLLSQVIDLAALIGVTEQEQRDLTGSLQKVVAYAVSHVRGPPSHSVNRETITE